MRKRNFKISIMLLLLLGSIEIKAQTVKDIDGNVYKTVKIGTQIWMAENLKTTKYNDGTTIPLVTDKTSWKNLTSNAYCHYNNTENIDTIAAYGRLYNWYTVNTGKLCPTGWHVPSSNEWTILTNFLGGESVAGGKLKATGTSNWISPNMGATNETGFTALSVGNRNQNGDFNGIGYFAFWWCVTEYKTHIFPGLFMLSFDKTGLYEEGAVEAAGMAIRCVKD